MDDPWTTSPPEKRIGDRERREVDAQLRQAHDDGVLTLTRVRRAGGGSAGRRGRRSELDALTRDLPDPASRVTTPAPARRARVAHAGPEELRRPVR